MNPRTGYNRLENGCSSHSTVDPDPRHDSCRFTLILRLENTPPVFDRPRIDAGAMHKPRRAPLSVSLQDAQEQSSHKPPALRHLSTNRLPQPVPQGQGHGAHSEAGTNQCTGSGCSGFGWSVTDACGNGSGFGAGLAEGAGTGAQDVSCTAAPAAPQSRLCRRAGSSA